MTANIHELFLQLVRLGIGTSKDVLNPKEVDWTAIKAMADKHGLSAIILDGLGEHHTDARKAMPKMMRLEWIGEVLQNYEVRYADYRKRIGELAGFYNQRGFKMMVLKGYGLSLNWPNPNHRPCGDIDIYAFGKYQEADNAIEKEFGIKVDHGHHHHTVFTWNGFSVENHYDFVNVHYGHKNAELESVYKKLAEDDSISVIVEEERIYLPSANLHALFLLRHCMQDFASAEMNLRQVLDWAFFVEKHTEEIDWAWLKMILEEYQMMDFFQVINAICIIDLGFDSKIFGQFQSDLDLKDRVLDDILNPKYGREEPQGLMKRISYKYRRWQGNAWKQKLCYNDSRWKAFWNGAWNHLLKPKTI